MADKMKKSIYDIRDVSDFYLNWNEFRPEILSMIEDEKIKEDERGSILKRVVELIDRIGDRDLM